MLTLGALVLALGALGLPSSALWLPVAALWNPLGALWICWGTLQLLVVVLWAHFWIPGIHLIGSLWTTSYKWASLFEQMCRL